MRLEHFCDSHIYKCRSQAEKYASLKIFAAVFLILLKWHELFV